MSGGTLDPFYKRLLWMIAIWLASVVALGIFALGIRWVIKP